MSQTLKSNIDLLEKLKSLDANDFDNDPLKAALLFRTLLYIDSLHDFTNKERATGIDIKDAEDMLNLLTKKFKEECYYLIYNLIKKFPDAKKILPIFNSKYKIQFVYNEVGKRYIPPTTQQNEDNKIFIKTNSSLATSICDNYDLYSNDYSNTILINFTPKIDLRRAEGHHILDKYKNYINTDIRKNHESNKPDNFYFIIYIAKILEDAYTKGINIQSNLNIYSEYIIQLFGFSPINSLVDNELKTVQANITPWGFVHGLLCIKNNKYNTIDTNQNSSCFFKEDNAYSPNVIFTVDAEASKTSKTYIDILIKLAASKTQNISSNPIIKMIRTKATMFDGASNSSYSKLGEQLKQAAYGLTTEQLKTYPTELTEPFNIDPDKSPIDIAEYNLEIDFTCGKDIKLFYISYTSTANEKIKVNLTKWFNKSVNKSKEDKNFTLATAIYDFKKNNTDPFTLYFKTICDIGQALAFITFEDNFKKKYNSIAKNFLYILHTNDRFLGKIASLLHPGIVVEYQKDTNQSINQILGGFANTIYISNRKINPNNPITNYNIPWQKYFTGIAVSARAAKKFIQNKLKESAQEFEKKLKDMEYNNLTLEVSKDLLIAKKDIKDAKKQLISQIRNLKHKVNLDNAKIKGLRKTRKLKKKMRKLAKTTAKKNDYTERRNKDFKKIQETKQEVISKQQEISRLQELLKQQNTNDEYHVSDHLSHISHNSSQISNSSSSSSLSSRAVSPEEYEDLKIVSARPAQSVPVNDKRQLDERQPILARVVKPKPGSPPKSNSQSAKKRRRSSSSPSSSASSSVSPLKSPDTKKQKIGSSSGTGKKTRRKNKK